MFPQDSTKQKFHSRHPKKLRGIWNFFACSPKDPGVVETTECAKDELLKRLEEKEVRTFIEWKKLAEPNDQGCNWRSYHVTVWLHSP